MALDYNDIEDLKYNPFTGDYNYTTIMDESHVIPAAPVNGSYMIRLYHAPRETIPSGVSITIGGSPLTEVSSAPSNMQFRVNYDEKGRGWVEFNSNQAGDTALISYSAYGTLMTTQTLQAIYNAFYIRPLIYGLSMTNNGSDPDFDIDFGDGWAFNTAESQRVQLSAMTKRLDATFVAGTGNGMLDTGSIAGDTDYYIYLIGKNSDLSAGDILASTNATTPALPTGWTNYTKIGICQTSGTTALRRGKWTRKNEILEFRYYQKINDRALAQCTTGRQLITITAPLGSTAKIEFYWIFSAATFSSTLYATWGETHEIDTDPVSFDTSRVSLGYTASEHFNSNTVVENLNIDSSKQVFYRATATSSINYVSLRVSTHGWEIAL